MIPRVRSGNFRHKIVIQSGSESTDNYGGATVSWSTYATVRGSLKVEGVDEQRIGDRTQQRKRAKMHTRYQSGITNGMRAVHGSDTYEIVGVDNVDAIGKLLELTLEQVS